MRRHVLARRPSVQFLLISEECHSESAQSLELGMWLLDLRTMETTG